MILARTEVIKEIASGKLVIDPFEEAALQACAYDLSLSDEIRVFKDVSEPIDLTEAIDWTKIADTDLTSKINIADGYLLKPNEFVLGISRERIDMPENLFGILTGRTRFARLGLIVHATAQFISPCTSNRQVFEMKNIGPLILKLVPGERIAQVVFSRCQGEVNECGTCKRQHTL